MLLLIYYYISRDVAHGQASKVRRKPYKPRPGAKSKMVDQDHKYVNRNIIKAKQKHLIH